MTSLKSVTLVAALSILVIASLDFSSAFADEASTGDNTNFNASHPRRAEVNQRLNNQNQRINKEEKSGEISQQKAARLHREDRHIRREERRMAAKNGGAITKQEQAKLNRQENRVSNQIGQ